MEDQKPLTAKEKSNTNLVEAEEMAKEGIKTPTEGTEENDDILEQSEDMILDEVRNSTGAGDVGDGETVGEESEYREIGDKETEGFHAEPCEEGFKIRPDLSDKFRPGIVQAMIEKTIKEYLEGVSYSLEDVPKWIRSITDTIHQKVKAYNYKRYKLISHVVLGERRGEGVSSATRCLWDADADCKATYTFLSDNMFCVGTVYGIYFY